MKQLISSKKSWQISLPLTGIVLLLINLRIRFDLFGAALHYWFAFSYCSLWKCNDYRVFGLGTCAFVFSRFIALLSQTFVECCVDFRTFFNLPKSFGILTLFTRYLFWFEALDIICISLFPCWCCPVEALLRHLLYVTVKHW